MRSVREHSPRACEESACEHTVFGGTHWALCPVALEPLVAAEEQSVIGAGAMVSVTVVGVMVSVSVFTISEIGISSVSFVMFWLLLVA